jgi:hypothetical protein
MKQKEHVFNAQIKNFGQGNLSGRGHEKSQNLTGPEGQGEEEGLK